MTFTGSCLLVAASALILAGCGGNSAGSPSAASNAAAAIKAAEAAAPASGPADPAAAGSPAPAASHDPGKVDVCSLLSTADASGVAAADLLTAGKSAATDYTTTAEKVDTLDPTSSECQYAIRSAGGGGGKVDFVVRAGSFIGEYTSDPKVAGLGDEAYDDGTSPAVRVGDLVVTAEVNSLPDHLTLDLLRKLTPHLS